MNEKAFFESKFEYSFHDTFFILVVLTTRLCNNLLEGAYEWKEHELQLQV